MTVGQLAALLLAVAAFAAPSRESCEADKAQAQRQIDLATQRLSEPISEAAKSVFKKNLERAQRNKERAESCLAADLPNLYIGGFGASSPCSSTSRSADLKLDCWCSKPARPVCTAECCRNFSNLKATVQAACEHAYLPAYDAYREKFRDWHAKCGGVEFTERLLQLPGVSAYDSVTSPTLSDGVFTASNTWAGVYIGFKLASRVPAAMSQADAALLVVHAADIGLATWEVRGATRDWQKESELLRTDCLYDKNACDQSAWQIGHNAHLLEIEREHDIRRAKAKFLGVFTMPDRALFPKGR